MAEPMAGTTETGPSTREQTQPYREELSDSESGESSAANPRPHLKTPKSGPWFTFDNIPVEARRDRMQEISAWVDLQKNVPGRTPNEILRELASRFTGTLRDWFESLGEYRQLQFFQSSTEAVLYALFKEFIGDPSIHRKQNEENFYNMKCCSLKRKDLDKHFKRMSDIYYLLGGYNSPELKRVFVASLPTELQPEINRLVTLSHRDIRDHGLGELFQYAIQALDKLCEQQKLVTEFFNNRKKLQKVCKKPYLQIKCKDKECNCRTKKKSHFKKFKQKERFPAKSSRRKGRFNLGGRPLKGSLIDVTSVASEGIMKTISLIKKNLPE